MSEISLATILLATDGSPHARLAARCGGALHVVHAWYVPPIAADDTRAEPDLALRDAACIYAMYESLARDVLDTETRLLAESGTAVAGAHLRPGGAGSAIVALADELNADLVVLGSRGLGPLRRLVLGSVAEEVVQHAPCPVLVLRGKERAWPPARVVIGIDGSDDAARAAGLGAAIGGRLGARGTLVRACPDLRHLPGLDPETAAEWCDEALAQARDALATRAGELAASLGERPSLHVATDDPAHLLLAIAGDSGGPALLVVGSRGLGTWERLRLGSTSTRLLHAAPCPVLVCPHRAAAGHAPGALSSEPVALRT